jgi:hypothetical protein
MAVGGVWGTIRRRAARFPTSEDQGVLQDDFGEDNND